MTNIVSKPDYGEVLISSDGRATLPMQTYLDDISLIINAILAGQQFTLPTTDPGVSGYLWNDAGTVKVST